MTGLPGAGRCMACTCCGCTTAAGQRWHTGRCHFWSAHARASSSRSQVARSTARSCLLAWGARRRAERRKSRRQGRAGDRHPPAARRPARRPVSGLSRTPSLPLLGPIRLCSETGPVHVVVPHRPPDSYINYLELHTPIIMALRLAEQGPLLTTWPGGRRESLGRAADHHAPGGHGGSTSSITRAPAGCAARCGASAFG